MEGFRLQIALIDSTCRVACERPAYGRPVNVRPHSRETSLQRKSSENRSPKGAEKMAVGQIEKNLWTRLPERRETCKEPS